MTFSKAYTYLLSLPRFTDQGAVALQPGLERMAALMEAMGHPQQAFESVHVAGTNGKGSTASMVAAIATATGRRVGLHTSPHLTYIGERLRIDGVPAPKSWIADAVARYREAMAAIRPSFFEATTALSLLYFAEQHVDLAVVEVGLGGRLDATNIIQPRLALITNIGLEHTDILGTTLPEIAREKAGIIKPGVPTLTAAVQPEVLDTLQAITDAKRASLHRIQDEVTVLAIRSTLDGLTLQLQTPIHRYDDLRVDLPGVHQQGNAFLAVRAAELLFETIAHHPEPVYSGLCDVRKLTGLQGRLDVLHRRPLIVADVAHNADGLTTALDFMGAYREPGRGTLYVMLGAMRDKDIDAMARLLAAAGAEIFPVALATERAWPIDDLAAYLLAHGIAVHAPGSVREIQERFLHQSHPDDMLLITGSHQVVAQAY